MKATSLLLRKEIALLQPLFCGDVESARRAQDRLGALGARGLREKVEYVPAIRAEFEADWARPVQLPTLPVRIPLVLRPVPPAQTSGAVLYLHGGGYTAGSLEYARGFGGVLAEQTGRPVLCVGYRLAPEHPYPAAVDDALAAYRHMLASYAPEEIAFIGESAGGGLCYALCLRARAEGLPLPACIVALSPWTDLTLGQPSIEKNAAIDPTLTREMLALYADMYAPHDKKNPFVSPLYGDLSGMPPSLLFAGTYEILEDDARTLAAALRRAGSECLLHVEEGGWHVYVLYGIYEARWAIKRICAFIGEKLEAQRGEDSGEA